MSLQSLREQITGSLDHSTSLTRNETSFWDILGWLPPLSIIIYPEKYIYERPDHVTASHLGSYLISKVIDTKPMACQQETYG